jgi:hypothetical protein
MKHSVPLLADLIKASNKRNGHDLDNDDAHRQPDLRARMKYGARLQRTAQFEEQEIDLWFRLNRRRNGIYSRCIE